MGGAGSAWHRWELRAYKVQPGGKAVGLRSPRPRRWCPMRASSSSASAATAQIEDATADTVLQEGDVVAVAGAREVLVNVLGRTRQEVEDRELLAVPIEGVDVFVTNKAVDGKTLAELATMPAARGVFLRKITRGATATDIPILPNTQIQRGDILTLVGRTQDTTAATKLLGVADRPTDVTDIAFIGAAIVVGALIGSLVFKVTGVPLTLSTAGGALIAGIVGGWLRSVRPSFGRIPTPTVWFMNSVGLNIFIAIVGISAGPGFVNGLKTQGIGLFLWGALATTVPLILGMFIAKYVFRFHDALNARHRFRRAHDDGIARAGLRLGQEPGPGARLHRHLRRRQHAAHDLGHGHHHAAVVRSRVSATATCKENSMDDHERSNNTKNWARSRSRTSSPRWHRSPRWKHPSRT